MLSLQPRSLAATLAFSVACCTAAAAAWFRSNRPDGFSVIDSFDPETLRFTLQQPREIKAGDRFETCAPSANGNLHDNAISGCQRPVVLSAYGSETSLLKGNLITRGAATGVRAAVEVCGPFKLIGNHISGFDETCSAALSRASDPLGRTARSVYRDNMVAKCTTIVPQDQAALWDAAEPEGNVIVECGEREDPNPAPSP